MTDENSSVLNLSLERAREADSRNRKAIERGRDELSAVPKDAVDLRSASEHVKADIASLRDIEDANERRFAAVSMADNAADQKNYKSELQRQDPHTAETVALALNNDVARLVAKEDQKADDLQRTGYVPSTGQASDASAASSRVEIDAALLDRMGVKRTRESAEAAAAMGLNTLEGSRDRTKVRAVDAADAGSADAPRALRNEIDADPLDMASKGADSRTVVPPEVEQRYRRDGNTFYERDKADTVAFEDKGTRLETRSSSQQVADSLVRIAHARGWEEIKVGGKEEFRREVWLEASAQGMKVKGYTPTEEDKAVLASRVGKGAELDQGSANTMESVKPGATSSQREGSAAGDKESPALSKRAQAFAHLNPVEGSAAYPELKGAYAIAAAIDKQSEAAGYSAEQRSVITARVRSNLVNSIDRGVYPTVKIKEQVEIPIEQKQEREQEATQGRSL
jgi:hypothetical protein